MISTQPAPVYDPNRIEANGNIKARPMEASSFFLICINMVNTITHFCLGAITFSAFAYTIVVKAISGYQPGYWINFHDHVYLCMIGYGVLMCQAILDFNPYVGWGAYLQPSQKRIISILMQICGSSLVVVGGMMKYYDWTWSLNSGHSYVGFIATILAIFHFFGGITSFIRTQKNRSKGSTFDFAHACFTAVTLTTAFIAMVFAFHVHYRTAGTHPAASLSVALTVFTMAGFLILIFVKYLKRM